MGLLYGFVNDNYINNCVSYVGLIQCDFIYQLNSIWNKEKLKNLLEYWKWLKSRILLLS